MKDVLKKSTLLAASGALLAGMAACGPTVPFNAQTGITNRVGSFANNPARAGKKWTVMIHLAADNNLYSFGLEDVNEMEAGLGENPAAADQVDIFVLFDGSPKGDSKILHILPDPGPVNTKIISEVIDDQGAVIPPSKEIDSGDPVVAAKFVDFITKNFPAEHTMHAFWNHGSGIFRSGTSSPEFLAGTSFFETVVGDGPRTRGSVSKLFAMDDNGGVMHLNDLGAIMAPALRNLGKPVDVVGFDACLMQHIETAYQYKGLANVLVASEELEPGKGWDYKGFIGPLAKNPNMSAAQLGKTMVDSYKASYSGGSQGSGTATLAAVDVNAVVNTFVPALNNLAAELTAALPANKANIANARSQTQTFYNRDAADLGDFLKKYASLNRGVSAASAKVEQAIAQTLIAEGHVGGKVAGATGIQVYFPTATMSVKSSYDDPNFLRFAETKGWSSFLHAFTGR